MKKCLFIMLGLSCLNQYAAIFDLKFTGSNAATVRINGKEYHIDVRNSTARVDTGFNGVSTISWTESLITNQKPGGDFNVEETEYQVNLPKPVSFINIGGVFIIGDKGDYAYYFGIDGRQDTVQKATKISGPKRVF